MLIKIGYDITLNFALPTAVIHLLHVHPSRRSDLVIPERLATDPPLPQKNIMTVSVTITGASVSLPGLSGF